jgi:TonB-dependent starch-binding outer membrane protein SusC
MNLKRMFLAMLLPLFAFCFQATAQDKVVTGKITDANGAALSGVTIKVKAGKTLGTSNSSGSFTVKAPATATLQFSMVGFGTAEMQIPASGTLNVSMKTTAADIGEVVVIGYGTAKKKDLTGSVASVSSKDFVKGAITTPEQLIQGKVAGVSIIQNDGAPGSGGTIRIRGGASIKASNDPLLIIDGVPVAAGDDGKVSGSANALSMINPNDIENMTVLKDASATAIYGSRASNGVIIITTKRGKSGKPQFTFSSMLNVYTPTNFVDVMDAGQFRSFVNQNGTTAYKALLGTANTNWQKEIYKTAIALDNNISVSGTHKNIPYRLSFGYLNQDGILKGGNLKRTSLGLNIAPKFFKDHLKVEVNLKGAVTNNIFANTDAVGAAIDYDPTQGIYSGNGRFGGYREWLDPTTQKPNGNRNPLALLALKNDRSHVERAIGNVQFDYKFHFLPDLRFNVNLGFDVQSGRGTTVISDSAAFSYQYYNNPANGKLLGGVNNFYLQSKENTLLDAYFNYAKETKYGTFDVLAGYSFQNFKTNDFKYADRTFDETVRADKIPAFLINIPENTLIGFYSRLKYSYKGKYMLSATIRRDASSRFAESNRWGTFPSVAGAWRIKDESFLKDVNFIKDLKLRASWGITGNQDGMGLYDYLSKYVLTNNTSMVQFGSSYYNGWSPSGFVPLKWEQTEMVNAGIDFSIAKGKINGTLEYFNRNTSDLYNLADLPAGSNFTNQINTNIGKMKSEGVELTLNTNLINKKETSFDLSFNITYNKNTITKLNLSDDPKFAGNRYGSIGNIAGTPVQINSVNYSRGSYFVYKQVYDAAGKPIEGMVADLNRDGAINQQGDLYRYKQVDPIIFLGITPSFTYKKITASCVLRGSVDNYVYNGRVARNANSAQVFQNSNGTYTQNTTTKLLDYNFSGGSDINPLSDMYVENASFIRMDNFNLGYNLGKILNSKADVRLGFNVQNVFVITKYTGQDPEVFGGIDNTQYVRPRVFSFNINVNF